MKTASTACSKGNPKTSDFRHVLKDDSTFMCFVVQTALLLTLFFSGLAAKFPQSGPMGNLGPNLLERMRAQKGIAAVLLCGDPMREETTIIYLILVLCVLFIGMVTAQTTFRFLGKKERATTLFSYGLTRKTLYRNRVLCGVGSVFLGTLLPMAVALGVNLAAFGASAALFSAALSQLLILFGISMVGFSFSVLMSSLCLRSGESALCTVLLALLPSSLVNLTETLMSLFLPGYASECSIGPQSSTYLFRNGLQFLNPLRGISLSEGSGEPPFLQCSFVKTPASGGTGLSGTLGTELFITGGWLLVCLGILLFACKAFRRYPVEKIGVRGASRVAVNVAAVSVGSMAANVAFELNTIVSAFVDEEVFSIALPLRWLCQSVVCAFAAGFLVSVFLYRSKKKLRAACGGALITVVPLLLITLLGATGLFGFSTRVPALENIQSVEIWLPDATVVPVEGESLMQEESYPDTYYSAEKTICLQTEKDIAIIRNIHSLSVGQGKKTKAACFTVAYQLKNGKSLVRRFIGLPREAILEERKLYETDYARARYQMYLTQKTFPQDATELFTAYYMLYGSPDSSLLLIRNDYSRVELKEKLNEAQWNALRTALWEDIASQNSEAMLLPKEKEVCILQFRIRLTLENGKKYSLLLEKAKGYGGESDEDSVWDAESYARTFLNVPVYANMTRTVKLLRAYGLYEQCAVGNTVTRVRTISAQQYGALNGDNPRLSTGLCFSLNAAEIVCDEDGSLWERYTDFADEYFNPEKVTDGSMRETTDPGEIAALWKNCRMHYLCGYCSEQGGRVALVTFSDGSEGLYYIPETENEGEK